LENTVFYVAANVVIVGLATGWPDFSWCNITKRGKIHIPNDFYIVIPKGLKIYQMVVKRPNGHKIHIPTCSIASPSKTDPDWFENIPSGNPDWLQEAF
jgi:hypothetical protein